METVGEGLGSYLFSTEKRTAVDKAGTFFFSVFFFLPKAPETLSVSPCTFLFRACCIHIRESQCFPTQEYSTYSSQIIKHTLAGDLTSLIPALSSVENSKNVATGLLYTHIYMYKIPLT